MLGYHPQSRYPPGADTPLEQTPPEQTPPGADTSLEQTPLWEQTPLEQTPPGPDTPLEQIPPPGSRLRHTVNERPVRILLECILVFNCYCSRYCAGSELSTCGGPRIFHRENVTLGVQRYFDHFGPKQHGIERNWTRGIRQCPQENVNV